MVNEYSVQLAQGLGSKDRVIIALDDISVYELKREFPVFFNKCMYKTFIMPHFSFPDLRKIFLVLRTYRKIVECKTDVIHIQVTCIYTETFLILWLAHYSGIPIVATLHDTKIHPGYSGFVKPHTAWLNFKTLELCSQIIVHGQRMADDLINVYGFNRKRINIIPHGNYDIYLHANGVSGNVALIPGQVLLFGRMRKYKGLETLVKAVPLIARKVPNVKVVLAGRGPELDKLEPKLRFSPFFKIFNRKIPSYEVFELFCKSVLIVLPYTEASQSGPLHLAYTFGRPIVATRVGAIPESLKDSCEGFLVPPNNPGELADAIIEILSNPDMARKFGHAGRIKADTILNWAGDISKKTRIVYEKAIVMKNRKRIFSGNGNTWRKIKNNYYQEVEHE